MWFQAKMVWQPIRLVDGFNYTFMPKYHIIAKNKTSLSTKKKFHSSSVDSILLHHLYNNPSSMLPQTTLSCLKKVTSSLLRHFNQPWYLIMKDLFKCWPNSSSLLLMLNKHVLPSKMKNWDIIAFIASIFSWTFVIS